MQSETNLYLEKNLEAKTVEVDEMSSEATKATTLAATIENQKSELTKMEKDKFTAQMEKRKIQSELSGEIRN